MTPQAYIKTLEKRMQRRKDALNKLKAKRYNPASYKDYNAYYLQQEMHFIQGIINELLPRKVKKTTP